MNDENGFLRAILEEPGNDFLLLVYADWLEEWGEPLSREKAEFIRLSLQQPRRGPRTENELRLRSIEIPRVSPIRRLLGYLGLGKPESPPEAPEGSSAARLRELADRFDHRWLAMVSRSEIEYCFWKGFLYRRGLAIPSDGNFFCDRRWENLQTTESETVRFCDTCQRYVHFCSSVADLRKHSAAEDCIALSLGDLRKSLDLIECEKPEMMGSMSLPLVEQYEAALRRFEELGRS